MCFSFTLSSSCAAQISTQHIKKGKKGRRKEEMNKNFSLNFYSSAQVVLHKCRLNRGQLHFARKTHSEWQIPKIYQRFDNDNHTIGVNVMISSKHMRAGRVIRERSGVSQQAITENNTPGRNTNTHRGRRERGGCVCFEIREHLVYIFF